MVKFNVLTEAFISNQSITPQYILDPSEVAALIAQSGNVLTFSGTNISLLLDLGFQKSVEKLQYTFTPTSLSGLTISYGRSTEDLFTATPGIVLNSAEVAPTESGYTYPRYFLLTHSATSGTPITLSGLVVLNDESDVDFGVSGTQEVISITSKDGFQGYSDVQELKVFNDGSIPANLYVSVDTSTSELDLLERLELSSTPTGTFAAFNEDISVPESVPFEWGDFALNTNLNSEGLLRLEDQTLSFKAFTVGTPLSLPAWAGGPSNARLFESRNATGQEVAVTNDNNLRFHLLDPRTSSTFISSNPDIIPSSTAQRQGHHPAWDGEDRIYYMLNNTDQVIRYYTISNNTHGTLTTLTSGFPRATRLVVHTGTDLYAGGMSSVSGTETSAGTLFTRINTSTLVQTTLTALPATPTADGSYMTYLNGYIYYIADRTSVNFYRYNIALNGWETLTNLPSGGQVLGLVGSVERGKVIVFMTNPTTGGTYEYTPLSGTFSSSVLSLYHPGTSVPNSATLIAESSLIVSQDTGNGEVRFVTALSEVPDPILPTTFSGTWLSPVFKLQGSENFHRVLLDYEPNEVAYVKFDNSVGVDNFEIRGSNSEPSAESLIENFDTSIDPDGYVTQTLDENSVVSVSGGSLVFNHDFIDVTETPFNRGFLYFSLPFNSDGKMQYKFWWNPANSKTVGSDNFSAFYLVPFLNTVDDGVVPDRSSSTLRRTANDYIYIRFGQSTDTAGSYTRLGVYNGSTTTNYTIAATTGKFYEITFLLDWSTGDYKLYFQGALLGSATIPLTQLVKLQTQHSFEFYSTGDSTDCTERFKHLTVSRVGNPVTFEGAGAVPVHLEDPLYGRAGSLEWFPVTVNSALIPKYDFVQLKITLRSNGELRSPTIDGIRFPNVVRLEDVPPSGTGSVYVRYNFPISNVVDTKTAFLKAWMATDKV